MCVYVCVGVYTYIYVYILYTYILVYTCIYIHVYVYIYIHIQAYRLTMSRRASKFFLLFIYIFLFIYTRIQVYVGGPEHSRACAGDACEPEAVLLARQAGGGTQAGVLHINGICVYTKCVMRSKNPAAV